MKPKFLSLEKDPHQPVNWFVVVTLVLAGVALWLLPLEIVIAIVRYVIIIGVLILIANFLRNL